MEPLVLHFAQGRVEGEGEDCMGAFNFEDSYAEGKVVVLVKQHSGQHSVSYEGRVERKGAIMGQWLVSPAWYGPFASMPVVERVDQLPITPISAGPVARASASWTRQEGSARLWQTAQIVRAFLWRSAPSRSILLPTDDTPAN
jgi:hypothetical protein